MNNEKAYPKLRGLICEKYAKQEYFARDMGMNPATLSKKLNRRSEWTCKEVERAIRLLSIPVDELELYFFS